MTAAADSLLKLTGDGDAAVQRASLESLRQLGEPRVLPLAIRAVNQSETQLTALACIGEFGTQEHTRLVVDAAKRHPSAETLRKAVSILSQWSTTNDLPAGARDELDHAVAEVHGSSGVLARWSVLGSLPVGVATEIAQTSSRPGEQPLKPDNEAAHWKSNSPPSSDSNFSLNFGQSNDPDAHWLGLSDVWVAENCDVQFLASSNGTLRVWLNGRSIYERPQAGAFQPDSDRFTSSLAQGPNRLIVQVSAAQSPIFHLRFRQKSSRAEHEQLVQTALARPGNAERGRKLFFDAEKSQCIKCHRLGDQGERFGPELTGVGNRFSRIHIIESILEPSRTLAPSYESITVALKDGRVLSGLRAAETETTLTLVDNQAAKHPIEKSAIEERRVQPTSIMPEGLEKRFTPDEFVDLIAYLLSEKVQ
jgi:putative heme-binding domain-containing protein